MIQYKSKVVLDLLSKHDFTGTAEELLEKLIYEDLSSIEDPNSLSKVGSRLKILGSWRGLSQPKYIELQDGHSGQTDGKQILINSNDPKSRQLFSWAHEIVHSYFNQSSGIKVNVLGKEHHFSGENVEEETLCDFGASLILLYEIKLESFTIASILEIIDKTKISAEAVAISMFKQNPNSNIGIIIWRRKCKKGENCNQLTLFLEEAKHPFRIDYAFSKNNFLPKNKSVNEGDAINFCEVNGRSSGNIGIKLNNKILNLTTDNLKISQNRVLTLFKS